MSPHRLSTSVQKRLLVLLVAGDALVAMLGLAAGYGLRFHTAVREIGVRPGRMEFADYIPLILVGAVLLGLTYVFFGVYDARLLLRPRRTLGRVLQSVALWFCIFLGVSLALRFHPPISRIFVALSCVMIMAFMAVWRQGFYGWLSRSRLREALMQRVLLVGWSGESAELVRAIGQDPYHPYVAAGWLATDTAGAPTPAPPAHLPYLGGLDRLDGALAASRAGIAVVCDLDLPRGTLAHIAATCERRYVRFMIIPSFFQIFLSNLRSDLLAGVPVLGVMDLPLRSLPNRFVKRLLDLVGATAGQLLSLPVIAVLAVIIRWQSPGPVFYKQVRTGRGGMPFTIYKLRSMRPDAEKSGAQWAVEGDARRLPIGAFMREWNLDELPQFWNILRGDMSLVGPRPERPELITKFEQEIPHYNPRHEVRPGLTGWAQVNGLRGNTSLIERIRYDLHYIENWSVWFDLQIMLLTFVRRQNAY